MERLLLLWDEVDELTGAARHATLMLAHNLAGAGQDAFTHVSGWLGTGSLRRAAALGEVSPEA